MKNLNSKWCIYLILFVALTNISCSQNNGTGGSVSANGFVVDPNVYFKVSFSGKTISTNQIFKDGDPLNFGALRAQIVTRTNTSGQTESMLQLSASCEEVNNWHNTIYPGLPWQSAESALITTRLGEAIGNYSKIVGGSISDLSFGSAQKIYNIEDATTTLNPNSPPSFNLVITSIDNMYVAGNFTCNLVDGSNRIPASGSFRLIRI